MESYYDRRQRLVSVFEDTQKRIAESSELQAAQLYSIEHQQLILESEEYASPLPAYETEAQHQLPHLQPCHKLLTKNLQHGERI